MIQFFASRLSKTVVPECNNSNCLNNWKDPIASSIGFDFWQSRGNTLFQLGRLVMAEEVSSTSTLRIQVVAPPGTCSSWTLGLRQRLYSPLYVPWPLHSSLAYLSCLGRKEHGTNSQDWRPMLERTRTIFRSRHRPSDHETDRKQLSGGLPRPRWASNKKSREREREAFYWMNKLSAGTLARNTSGTRSRR